MLEKRHCPPLFLDLDLDLHLDPRFLSVGDEALLPPVFLYSRPFSFLFFRFTTLPIRRAPQPLGRDRMLRYGHTGALRVMTKAEKKENEALFLLFVG